MRIIYNRFIPFRRFKAINLFGVVFARHEFNPLNDRTIRHERIHTAQMREMLYIFFYVWYLFEWLFRLFQYRFNGMKAYRNISFEREAFMNDTVINYLKFRRFWDWARYLRKEV